MDLFYKILLSLHSWNRYTILAAALVVVFLSVRGLRAGTTYGNADRKSMLFYLSGLHFQLLLGILLYFFASPLTSIAFNDFGAAMKDAVLRFWAVEHALVNVIAVAIAQAGSILVKRRNNDAARHRTALVYTLISIILILLMIPMGLMGVERPWFRF